MHDSTLDVINQINTFYESAWNKLVLAGTLMVAIVGILVPLLIQWWQKRTIKIQQDAIESELKLYVNNLKNEMVSEINSDMMKEIEKIKIEQQKSISQLDGRIFHVQGLLNDERKNYGYALIDYVTAGDNYLYCEDFRNLSFILKNIKITLGVTSKETINKLKSREELDIDTFLKKVESKDNKGLLLDEIRDIRENIKILKK